jgi:hypothetical protein
MDHEKSKFYAKALKCMWAGYIAELDIKALRESVTLARLECEFHKQMASFYLSELQRYQVVKETMETHDLQAMIDAIKGEEKQRKEALQSRI